MDEMIKREMDGIEQTEEKFDSETQLRYLTEKINKLIKEKSCVVVGIDGSCTSGKSTLAGWLAERYDCNVFHMDDFFLRQEQRTEERFAEPGGNVDRERFAEEVLLPLVAWKNNEFKDFEYRPYICSEQSLGGAVKVGRKQLNIIEGSYCLHPELEYAYDLKVLLAVHPEVRRERILARPEFLHQRFFEEWIPMEQKYFNSSNITERCDIIIVGLNI